MGRIGDGRPAGLTLPAYSVSPLSDADSVTGPGCANDFLPLVSRVEPFAPAAILVNGEKKNFQCLS
jgi:hypothetical protein